MAASSPIDKRPNPLENRETAATDDPYADNLFAIKSLGRLLDDIERMRISDANRIGAGEREIGGSFPGLHHVHAQLADTEKIAIKELKLAWKQHPLSAWSHGIPGAGEKLMARLIAVTGDPAERETVSQFWAYCGHGDPRRRRKSGMTQAEAFKLGNPEAKKRTWLIAAQFVKTASSPYRKTYEEARARYAERKHELPCVRCGPSGHPALPGSEWSLGHQHAAALRFVGKAFLRDLWVEAQRLRAEEE